MPITDKHLARAVDLYKDNLFYRFYSLIRAWDAPYEKVENLIPERSFVADLGCGDGLFANYLAVKSPKRKVVGIDSNGRRISQADKGLKNTRFIKADVLKAGLPDADTVIMYHLLHHMNSFGDQVALLEKVRRHLKKRGRLIIVEIDKDFSLKFLITWVVDRFIYPALFDRKFYEKKIFFRTKKEWKKLLSRLGYKTKIISAEKGKPFSHIAIVCRK